MSPTERKEVAQARAVLTHLDELLEASNTDPPLTHSQYRLQWSDLCDRWVKAYNRWYDLCMKHNMIAG